MELSWLMRLRIAAVAVVGILLVGFIGRPPGLWSEQAGIAGNGSVIILLVLAFLSGAVGYFVSWPYGRHLGILAAPFGLTVWGLRADSMTSLMQLNPTVGQRQELFTLIRWEPLFWLLIVAAGFAGVILVHNMITSGKSEPPQDKQALKPVVLFNGIIAVIASVVIAQLGIGLLAQGVRMFDNRLGSMVAQPAVGQIIFAVFVSFGVAAFVVKKLLNASYIWPIISTLFVTFFVTYAFAREQVLAYLTQTWPAPFYPNALVCVLPVQMVAFGTLGSVAGYWLAESYSFGRKEGS